MGRREEYVTRGLLILTAIGSGILAMGTTSVTPLLLGVLILLIGSVALSWRGAAWGRWLLGVVATPLACLFYLGVASSNAGTGARLFSLVVSFSTLGVYSLLHLWPPAAWFFDGMRGSGESARPLVDPEAVSVGNHVRRSFGGMTPLVAFLIAVVLSTLQPTRSSMTSATSDRPKQVVSRAWESPFLDTRNATPDLTGTWYLAESAYGRQTEVLLSLKQSGMTLTGTHGTRRIPVTGRVTRDSVYLTASANPGLPGTTVVVYSARISGDDTFSGVAYARSPTFGSGTWTFRAFRLPLDVSEP